MSTAESVLRPQKPGIAGALPGILMGALPTVLGLLRAIWPIPHLGKTWAVTRHDDVRELFGTDAAFGGPYRDKLDVVLDREPFILGMDDGDEYRADIAALRGVIRNDDLPRLAARVEAQAATIVAGSGGQVEVVDALVRRIAFDYLSEYFGVPGPADADLRVWATRLFEFVFFGGDDALTVEATAIARQLRDHLDAEIARRKAVGNPGDDVLARCLARQAAGDARFTDRWIRTMVAGMIIGGPPQPPMAVPQAMEQLLRRPAALALAQTAARANDDARLFAIVYEALRFDPLAPAVPRVANAARLIAAGTPRAVTIPAGVRVLVGVSSAMHDPRRIPNPAAFSADRLPYEYFHTGYGLHECFGRYLNQATLAMYLKPLLARPNLRRAPGKAGRLIKNGPFAEALTVEFG